MVAALLLRRHLLIILPLALGPHPFRRRVKDGLGFAGLNLHLRDGELGFILHALHVHARLEVRLLALGIGQYPLLLTRSGRLLLDRLGLNLARLGVKGLGELLEHLALLLQLLLKLLGIRLPVLLLQGRREEFLDPRGGFVMAGEIPKLEIQVPENRKERGVGLKQLPHLVGALERARLEGAPNRDHHPVAAFP